MNMEVILEDLKFRAMSSVIQSRTAIASMLGKAFGNARDVYEALGYPGLDEITADMFYGKYRRQDIATRIVDAVPKEAWEKDPVIKEKEKAGKEETPFESEWKTLQKQLGVYSKMERGNIVSRIGRFGILVLGFNDQATIDQPLQNPSELLYLHPYGEWAVTVRSFENDDKSPRFGLPVMYQITVSDGEVSRNRTLNVHHSRVIHIAEGLLDNNTYGTAVLENVFNRLENLELIVGGSAEMFWQGAFQGLAFLAKDGYDLTEDQDEMNEKISKFVHKMQRYLVLKGVDIEKMSPNIESPKEHFEVQIDLISAAKAYPKRILLGSERGQLASSQDDENWTSRIEHYRTTHCEMVILRPFIDLLIKHGILPEPSSDEYVVEWPSLLEPSDKDRAEVAKAIAEAFNKWMTTPGAEFMDPIMFFEDVLGWEEEKIERLRKQIESYLKGMKDEDKGLQGGDGEPDEEE